MNDRNSTNSQNAGFGSKNLTPESSVDVEREPMPDRTPETDSDDPHMPPARSGSVAETHEKPTGAIRATTPCITQGTCHRP
jgi:hypothetical protein